MLNGWDRIQADWGECGRMSWLAVAGGNCAVHSEPDSRGDRLFVLLVLLRPKYFAKEGNRIARNGQRMEISLGSYDKMTPPWPLKTELEFELLLAVYHEYLIFHPSCYEYIYLNEYLIWQANLRSSRIFSYLQHLISQSTIGLMLTIFLLPTIPPDFVFIVNVSRRHDRFVSSLDSIINLCHKSNREQ